MPVILINFMAVIAATISSMIIGYLWYGPLFGKVWTKLSSAKEKKNDEKRKMYALQFIGSLFMAFVLAKMVVSVISMIELQYVVPQQLLVGLTVAFWAWAGFVAPVTLGTVLWDKKPWMLWVLNNAYYLVTFCVMGIILAYWR